ncbi:hypothetical protein [Paraburkholderia pallida]|uniref:DUF4148 domain-containing protein n=1 Tax=Paraburkholderia pallida TaxID=2547399 RepID=A0A4P7D1T9_9BURK|nr:hypothetical protein [Paraburkholderia pallida]QBR01848.1 hypothetical protein E1956_32410 [Paraburkholderia pallida]
MNAILKRAIPLIPLVLMTASSLACAAGHLTPQQCNSYPFKSAHGALSSDDVARELNELASVGYRPGIDNYSPDIADARAKLNAEYAKDCAPGASTASQSATGAATSG